MDSEFHLRDPRIRASRTVVYGDRIDLWAGASDGGCVVEKIVYRKVDDREMCLLCQPSFSLSPEAAQVLMDDLWACGVRPTEGAGSAGAMRATERHLEDMRALVFKLEPKGRVF